MLHAPPGSGQNGGKLPSVGASLAASTGSAAQVTTRRGHRSVVGACMPDEVDELPEQAFGLAFGRQYLPSGVDLRRWLSPVEDEGALGACSATALASAVEYLAQRETSRHIEVSRLFIYYNQRLLVNSVRRDSGASIKSGVRVLARLGVPHERSWPYAIDLFAVQPPESVYQAAARHRIVDYARVPIDADALRGCLAGGLPVVLGLGVHASFRELQAPGFVSLPVAQDPHEGRHALLLVGYCDRASAFIARNGWGTDWGDAGYCYLPYGYVLDPRFRASAWTLRTSADLAFDDREHLAPELLEARVAAARAAPVSPGQAAPLGTGPAPLSAAPTTALGLLAALATGKTSPLELAFELAVFQASAWVTRATGSAAAGNVAGGVVRQIAPALKRGGSFSVQAVGQALMGAVLAPMPSPGPAGVPAATSPGAPGLDPGLLIAPDRTREIWAALHAPPSGMPTTRHRWDDTYDEEAIVAREAPSPVLTRPQAATPATVRPPAQPAAIHVAGSPGVSANTTAPRVRRSAPGTLLMPVVPSPAELSALQPPTPAEKPRVEPAVSERLVAVWRAMGGDAGLLGARSGAPFLLADGVGSGLACERGAVVGHPELGAFALTYGIFDTWVRTGAESGPLGYPVRPETQVTGGAAEARVARLQGGLIVDWQPLGDRDPPPFVILAGDALVRAWLEGGAEQSPVGTPVAPPQDIGPQDLPQRGGRAAAHAGAAQARVLFCSHGALAYTEREGLRYLRAQDYADWLRQLR